MSEYGYDIAPEDPTCSVFRSEIDDGVWMCNIPFFDIATGIQASTSLRKIKAYVESKTDPGYWYKTEDGSWEYVIR